MKKKLRVIRFTDARCPASVGWPTEYRRPELAFYRPGEKTACLFIEDEEVRCGYFRLVALDTEDDEGDGTEDFTLQLESGVQAYCFKSDSIFRVDQEGSSCFVPWLNSFTECSVPREVLELFSPETARRLERLSRNPESFEDRVVPTFVGGTNSSGLQWWRESHPELLRSARVYPQDASAVPELEEVRGKRLCGGQLPLSPALAASEVLLLPRDSEGRRFSRLEEFPQEASLERGIVRLQELQD